MYPIKYTLIFIVTCCFTFGFSQTSNKFNFQMLIRNAQEEPLADKQITVDVSLFSDDNGSLLFYKERHTLITDFMGVASMVIGEGTLLSGNLSISPRFLNIEVDPEGGTNFSINFSEKLSSVPFSQFSEVSLKIPPKSVEAVNIASGTLPLSKLGFPYVTKDILQNLEEILSILSSFNEDSIPKLGDLSVRYTGNDSLFINGFVEQESAIGLLSRGLVWDTIPNPTIKSNNISIESNPDLIINQLLTNWIAGKKYFIRAFATNAYGTGYSALRTFEPGGVKCKDGDKLTLSSFHGDTIDIDKTLSFWVEEYDNLHSLNYELNGTKYASSYYRQNLVNPGTAFWVRAEAFHKSGCKMLSDTLRFKVLNLRKAVTVISRLIISANVGEKVYSYSSEEESDVTGKTSWKLKVDVNMGSDIVFLGRRKEGFEDENLGLTYAVPGRDTLYLSAEHTAYTLLYLHAAGRKKSTLQAMETFMKSKLDFTILVKMLDDELIKNGSLDLFSEEKNSLIIKLLDEWILFPGSVQNKETNERPSPLFLPSVIGRTLEYDSGGKPYFYAVVAANKETTKPYNQGFLFRNTGSAYNTDLYSLLVKLLMDSDKYRTPDLTKGLKTLSLSSEEMNLPSLKEGAIDSFMIVIQSGLSFKGEYNIQGNIKARLANIMDFMWDLFGFSPVGKFLKFVEPFYQNPCVFSAISNIWTVFSNLVDLFLTDDLRSPKDYTEIIKDFFEKWFKGWKDFFDDIYKEKGCLEPLIPKRNIASIRSNLKLVGNLISLYDFVKLGTKVFDWTSQPIRQEQTYYFMNGGIIQGRHILSHNFNKNFFGAPGGYLAPDPVVSFRKYEYVSKEYLRVPINTPGGGYIYGLKEEEKLGDLFPANHFLPLTLRVLLGGNSESITLNDGRMINMADQKVVFKESENILKWKVGKLVLPGKNKYMGSMAEAYIPANLENVAFLPNVLSAEIGGCPEMPVMEDLDGNVYPTVKIGTQCWMQSNLKVSKYRNGDAIPTGLSDDAWNKTTSGAYAIYDNSNANDAIYGKLYNWYAVKDVRSLCPTGWHVPSDLEWTILTDYLGGLSVAGGKMKSVGITYWNSPNTGATNESGFSVLPGGYRDDYGSFYNVRDFAFFWSATENYNYNAWNRFLYFHLGSVYRDNGYDKSVGGSVRCLRN